MEKKYTDILWKIGELRFLDDESKQILTSIDDGYYINYSENWGGNLIESFADNELICIFYGLVVAEQCYTDLCGSATVGTQLYLEIRRRRLDINLAIANWAFITTRNGYIPFGSNRGNAKDVYDFIRDSVDYHIRIAFEKTNKEKKLLSLKIEGLNKRISKKDCEIQTLKRRLELSKLQRTDIANIIINDNLNTVYYYYHEIESLINDKSVAKNLLEEILNKFKEKERKNNNDLKRRLIKEITSR